MSVTDSQSVTAIFVKPKRFVAVVLIMHVAAFAATMTVNNCVVATNSEERWAYTLELMGALTRYTINNHQLWRLFTSPCLHAGLFHLILNLPSVVVIGAHLESEFDSGRIAILYILSALTGSSLATLILQDRPIVASSGALFGLLGATRSTAVRKRIISKKSATVFFFITMSNVLFGLMPYVSNFSNLGAFVCGFLAGFVLLSKPQVGQHQAIGGTFNNKMKLKFVILLILSSLILAAMAQPQQYRFVEERGIQRDMENLEAINRKLYKATKAKTESDSQVYSRAVISVLLGLLLLVILAKMVLTRVNH